MTRLAGFLLVQLAAALFARGRIAESAACTGALRSFCNMLDQLRGLLESDGSPMPALLQTLAGRADGAARTFVAALLDGLGSLGSVSFHTLWTQALTETAALLEADMRRELDALGGVLGRYELSTQLDALDHCRRCLRERLEARQRTQAQDTRLTLGLSLSVSLLLGILLI